MWLHVAHVAIFFRVASLALGQLYDRLNASEVTQRVYIPVKLPCIFPGAPLKVSGAPGNFQGNLTGMDVAQSTITKPQQKHVAKHQLCR